jgi:predicted TIM-barrel fold metal-dependent hydrolase
VFQDLHVIDFHAHFPIPTNMSHGHGPEKREVGPIENPAALARRVQREQALERTRHQWRMAFDFPEPEAEQPSADVQAERWVAELDRYGIERIGFVTGQDNDELARFVKVYPDRFIGFAHHDITRPDAAAELERAVRELGLRALKLLAPTIPVLINDRSLYPVWETCERLGIPVLCHFGLLGAAGGVC